jgi:hypothetical protein
LDLPRPRSRGAAQFGPLYEEINNLIKEEVQLGRQDVYGDR